MASCGQATLSKDRKEERGSKQSKPSPIPHHPPTPTPSETQNLTPETPDPSPTAQFVEELPDDFWDREPVPVEAYSEEARPVETQAVETQAVETHPVKANSKEASSIPASKQPNPKAQDSSLVHHPLFAELQRLFPGKIVRIETTKPEAKTGDDTKDEIDAPNDVDVSLDELET